MYVASWENAANSYWCLLLYGYNCERNGYWASGQRERERERGGEGGHLVYRSGDLSHFISNICLFFEGKYPEKCGFCTKYQASNIKKKWYKHIVFTTLKVLVVCQQKCRQLSKAYSCEKPVGMWVNIYKLLICLYLDVLTLKLWYRGCDFSCTVVFGVPPPVYLCTWTDA